VRNKAIHFDATVHPSQLTEYLLAEIRARDNEIEISYRDTQRLALRATPAPVDRNSAPALAIDSDSVVLVTGGARGITAEVASELARRYRPTLVLVGRSPLPEPEESAQTAAFSSPRELKAALIEQMRRAGQTVSPAQVEAAYAKLLRDREIR